MRKARYVITRFFVHAAMAVLPDGDPWPYERLLWVDHSLKMSLKSQIPGGPNA
jgi:hypothetical protein